ncbi:MAG: IclR family transcriptional regulator [Deltaproteobacteria bacterium]|nr:IclR family transcriptional regulator [Deltaproteobacteria bacterium]
MERAIAVLNTFSFKNPDLTLKEITDKTGLSKPTVFRILSTLEPHNYVALDHSSGRYRLGSRIMELGGVVNSSITLRKVARPRLTDLQVDTGATVLLGALMDDELVYIGKRETDGPIRIASDVGWRRSPHFGMLGMVLMAYKDRAEVDRLLAKSPLIPHTRFSILDRDRFLERLEDVKKCGYLLEFNEAIEGAWGVAAPVRDAAGTVVAALGTTLPLVERSDSRIAEVVAAVRKRAAEVSRDMGYREPS